MQNCLPEGGFDKFDAGDLAEGKTSKYMTVCGQLMKTVLITTNSHSLRNPSFSKLQNFTQNNDRMINLC